MTLKKHQLFLCAALAATLLAGACLALSPTLEHKRVQAAQDELLKSTLQGSGTVNVRERVAKLELADYIEPEMDDVIVLAAQGATPPVPETTTPDPIPIAGEITGIGILTIDCIDAKLPVTDGVSKEQLKIAEGWVPQTAPIGGEGNAVIAGHRSYTYGMHFNRLGELTIGDTIQYDSVDGENMTFTVSEILTMEPGDPAVFAQPAEGVSQLTLYTCTPIRTATHRLLVRAVRTV